MTTTGSVPGNAAHPCGVAVFDLDDTLVRGDSFGRFLKRRITGHPLRLVVAVVTAPLWIGAWLFPRTRVLAESCLVWVAAAGAPAEAFAGAARDFAVEHVGAHGEGLSGAAMERLWRHLDAGHRVLVVTACAQPLAQAVCDAAGLREVEVIASTISRSTWGFPSQVRALRGEEKLRALKAAGVSLPVDDAYSDSYSDLPLLKCARKPHIVNPSPRDLKRLRRVLGDDVDVWGW